MPRKAKAVQVAEVAQPALFEDFSEQPELIAAAAVYTPNGKTTCKNEERAFAIVEDLIRGVSQRKVAKRHVVGRGTLAGIVEQLERQGKLKPLKQRLVGKFGQFVEHGIDAMNEAMVDGTFPITHAGLAVAQITDKLLLLQGDPTVIVGTVDHGPTTEQLNAWLQAIPVEVSGPVELPEISLNKGNAPGNANGPVLVGPGNGVLDGQRALPPVGPGPVIDVPADGQSTGSEAEKGENA